MILYPGATPRLIGKDGGAMVGGPPRGVVHTTETPAHRPYTKDYYHLNIAEPTPGVAEVSQLIPLDRASRALRRPDSLQTNRMGAFCVNVSISGYAKDRRTDTVLLELAEIVNWCEDHLGIPAVFPRPFSGSNCYGEHSACRMTDQEWRDVTGWVGHQHVPRNGHWDPGMLNTARLTELTGGLRLMFPDVPNGHPHQQAIEWAATEGLVQGGTDGRFRPDEPATRAQLATILHRFHNRYLREETP